MGKPTLSIAMIIKNEAHHLPRILECVQSFADEIIIVDTGSTDGSREIAAQYTPHIYEYTRHDDFAAARNESFRHCTCDYIMRLDADDWLSPRDRHAIPTLLTTHRHKDIFFLPYHVQYTSWYEPIQTIQRARIVRNHPSVMFVQPIHEYLVYHEELLCHHVDDIAIWHANEGRHENNHRRNIRIALKQLETKPTHGLARRAMAKERSNMGRHHDAVACYRHAINYGSSSNKRYISRLYYWLGKSLTAINDYTEAANAYHIAHDTFWWRREPLYQLALLYRDYLDDITLSKQLISQLSSIRPHKYQHIYNHTLYHYSFHY